MTSKLSGWQKQITPAGGRVMDQTLKGYRPSPTRPCLVDAIPRTTEPPLHVRGMFTWPRVQFWLTTNNADRQIKVFCFACGATHTDQWKDYFREDSPGSYVPDKIMPKLDGGIIKVQGVEYRCPCAAGNVYRTHRTASEDQQNQAELADCQREVDMEVERAERPGQFLNVLDDLLKKAKGMGP